MQVLETDRLSLRELTRDDAPFILELLNEPGWLRFIGDRGVRTVEQARDYLAAGPMALYTRFGYGLYHAALKGGEPVGICGFVKRDGLAHADLGFALLARHEGRGYAREAAKGCLEHGRAVLGLGRVLAITDLDNARSIALLRSLGFRPEGTVRLAEDAPALNLFALDLPAPDMGPTP